MCVDGASVIAQSFHISLVNILQSPSKPSLVVIASKGSQTDSHPSFLTQRWQRMFSARKGSGPLRSMPGPDGYQVLPVSYWPDPQLVTHGDS